MTLNRKSLPQALVLACVLGVAAIGTGCTSMDTHTGESAQPAQDTWITTKVMTQLATIEGIDSTDIGVETSNGVVNFTGHVDSQAQVNTLVAAAKRVDGVVAVKTDLLQVVAE